MIIDNNVLNRQPISNPYVYNYMFVCTATTIIAMATITSTNEILVIHK